MHISVKVVPSYPTTNTLMKLKNLEAVSQMFSVKKIFLKISQHSQENTCARVSFNFIKKRLWRRCFPVICAKFLRIPFLTEHLRWLLLEINQFQPSAAFHIENSHLFCS